MPKEGETDVNHTLTSFLSWKASVHCLCLVRGDLNASQKEIVSDISFCAALLKDSLPG